MALKGLRVLELQGLAPVPFAGMILRDFGARVIRVDRVDRPDKSAQPPDASLNRGKESFAVNLKNPEGSKVLLKLASLSDILLDPYRPGVLERLGLGPDVLMERNPKLIIARLTGYGQTGPLSHVAGHDINYAAMSGILSVLGRQGSPPTPPTNLLADFAGGSMTCVLGVLMAVIQRSTTGKGQIVDSSMVEGSAYLGTFINRCRQCGLWGAPRGQNLLDTGCPFYDTYETKDGKWIAVGCLEPGFYREFISRLGVPTQDLPDQQDVSQWGTLRKIFTTTIQSKTREEWETIYKDTDACVSPVLELDEWARHPNTVERAGQWPDKLPAPAPRLLLSPNQGMAESGTEPQHGQNTLAILDELGYTPEQVAMLVDCKAVAPAIFD